PPQLGHRAAGFLAADEPPRPLKPARGVPVRSGRDAEGAGLGNRLAEQVDERVMDARVGDASGSEKKFHAASRVIAAGQNGTDGSVRSRDWRSTESSSAQPDPASHPSGDIPEHAAMRSISPS